MLTRVDYDRLLAAVETALRRGHAHRGPISEIDQEVLVELQTLRLWLGSAISYHTHMNSFASTESAGIAEDSPRVRDAPARPLES